MSKKKQTAPEASPTKGGDANGADDDRLVAALLAEAAVQGWRDLSLTGVAERTGLTLGQLLVRTPTKAHLASLFFRHLDTATLAPVTAADPADGPRDRVFEVLMRRFDALNRHRQGARALILGISRDPGSAAMGWLRLDRASAAMLEAAGISAHGLVGCTRAQGLKAIYLATLRTWLRDDSEDMAQTMAALDRALRQAERLLRLVPGRWRAPSPAASEPAPDPAV